MEIDEVIAVDVAPGQGLGLSSGQRLVEGEGKSKSEGEGAGLSVVVLVSGRWHGEMDLSTRGGEEAEGQEQVVAGEGESLGLWSLLAQ